MRQALIFIAAAACPLAACSQSASTPTEEVTGAAGTSTTPSPLVTPTTAPTTAAAIPERFRGVWDFVEGTCDPASDLRMEIGAVSIEFYKSLGTVTGVTIESPDSVTVDLAMEGEGERWTVSNRLVLSEDGATLTPVDADGPPAKPMPRRRCAT